MLENQVVGTHRFENGNSEVGIETGGIVYIKNKSDVFNNTWYMTEDIDNEWIFQYDDEDGSLNISRVDWVLHGLLEDTESTSPLNIKSAVAKNATARKWVNDLNEAQERVNFWFSSGCPTTKKEQGTIMEWSNIKNPSSPWECHRQNTANEILKMQIVIKAQELKTQDEESDKDTRK